MTTQIRVRRSTSAEWSAANPVLAEAEPGLDTTLKNFKFGDGVTHWNDLPFQIPVGILLVDNGTTLAEIAAMNPPYGTVIFERG